MLISALCEDLCYDYEAKGHTCPDHGTAQLVELYDHVSLNVSHPDNLEEYVKWDLRRCFGDTQIDLTPGDADVHVKSFSSHRNTNGNAAPILAVTAKRLRTIIEPITIDQNVTIARLYLDNIYKNRSFDVVSKMSDRLSRNIIAFFDAGIEHIRQQPKQDADIALLAIAAVGEQEHGILLRTLEEWMRDALSRLPHLANSPPRSLEDILRCASGFILEAESDQEYRMISTYSSHFRLYVKENYNETLFWARSQLNIRRISRTLTTMVPSPAKFTSPPIVTSPPTMDGAFDLTAGPGSNPLRGSPPEYFDRSIFSSGFKFPPKTKLSLPNFPIDTDAELGIKKLLRGNRTLTMLPTRKSTFRSDIAKINEEETPDVDRKSRITRSIHR
jgi:hypothetical protein